MPPGNGLVASLCCHNGGGQPRIANVTIEVPVVADDFDLFGTALSGLWPHIEPNGS